MQSSPHKHRYPLNKAVRLYQVRFLNWILRDKDNAYIVPKLTSSTSSVILKKVWKTIIERN